MQSSKFHILYVNKWHVKISKSLEYAAYPLFIYKQAHFKAADLQIIAHLNK